MIHIKPTLVLLIASTIVFVACKKKETAPKDEITDIYIAGTMDKKPVYWKNGIATTLTGGLNGEGSAIAIAASGNDVYVAGTLPTGKLNEPSRLAVYWKNGVIINLQTADAGSTATGIAIAGTDVYVVGSVYNGIGAMSACYWKNGTKTILEDNATLNTTATAIAVNGNDIYIVGSGKVFGYWKNGTRVNLPVSALGGLLQDIAVNEKNDVFVSGSQNIQVTPTVVHSRAFYWKNAISTEVIADGTYSTFLKGITTKGDDVYMSGFYFVSPSTYRAYHTKNNIILNISDGTPSFLNDIALKSDDIYTVGYTGTMSDGKTYAQLWKNGVAMQLSQNYSEASAITISTH